MNTTPTALMFSHPWYYLDGRKYWHQDVDQIANMRHKGVGDGKLVGKELESFVVSCLRTADYQVLGMPADVPSNAVRALQVS